MFKFLKDKLKGAISKFSKHVEDEVTPIKELQEGISEEDLAGEGWKEESIEAHEKKEQHATAPTITASVQQPAPVLETPATLKEMSAPSQKQETLTAKKNAELIDTRRTLPVPELPEKDYEFVDMDMPLIEEVRDEEKIPVDERMEDVKVVFGDKEAKMLEEEEGDARDLPLQEEREEPRTKSHEENRLQKKGFFARIKHTFIRKNESASTETSTPPVEVPDKKDAPHIEEEATGFFGKISQRLTTKRLTDEQFNDLFWELEVVLLENNVALEVIEKIKENLRVNLVEKPIPRLSVEEVVANTLKDSINEMFKGITPLDLIARAHNKKPFVICFVGINGSGKTTTIAKVAKLFQNEGFSVVIAAADTFRAAAIDQLQLHADALGVKLIKQDYGSDAAAVAFDAVKHAEQKNKDVVLIDTAGRLHSNSNLVDEMKKIVRVAKPDINIFVGESITGNDCVEQAKKFDEAIGINGIILSKADVDEKGGAAISISYVTKKPVLYIGTGQDYADLAKFDAATITKQLEL